MCLTHQAGLFPLVLGKHFKEKRVQPEQKGGSLCPRGVVPRPEGLSEKTWKQRAWAWASGREAIPSLSPATRPLKPEGREAGLEGVWRMFQSLIFQTSKASPRKSLCSQARLLCVPPHRRKGLVSCGAGSGPCCLWLFVPEKLELRPASFLPLLPCASSLCDSQCQPGVGLGTQIRN